MLIKFPNFGPESIGVYGEVSPAHLHVAGPGGDGGVGGGRGGDEFLQEAAQALHLLLGEAQVLGQLHHSYHI